MYRTSNSKADIVKATVDSIIREGKSAVLRLKRVPFDDPLLTVYFVKGRPIMAHSFIVHEPWYEGLINSSELDNAQENLVAYAYRKYGEGFFAHLERYTRKVIDRVVWGIKENGWDFNISVRALHEGAIKRLFGSGSDLSFQMEGKGTLSILPELNSMGITSVSFVEGGDILGDRPNVFKDIHDRILSLGIGGHYVLFFPYAAVIHGQIKGKDFVGEIEYGPNVFRVFPLLKREVGGIPKILEEFPWETSGKINFGRPFAMYLRYRGHGILICLRATEENIYICSVEVSTPERTIEKVERMRERTLEAAERFMQSSRDMPRSVLRVKVGSYIRRFPHPDDLERALKLSFGG